MAGPSGVGEWAAFFAEQRARREAAQPRERPAKQPAPDMRPHPLLSPPSFPPGIPVEVQMHFITAHLRHRYQAEEAVRQHHEARRVDEQVRRMLPPLFGGTAQPEPQPPE